MAEREALTRLGLARIPVCDACEHCVLFTCGRNWKCCWLKGLDADGRPNVELDETAWKGPESFCPLGKWAGIVGQTEGEADADKAEDLRFSAIAFVKRLEPLLLQATDVELALNQMVQQPKPYKMYAATRDAILAELENANA